MIRCTAPDGYTFEVQAMTEGQYAWAIERDRFTEFLAHLERVGVKPETVESDQPVSDKASQSGVSDRKPNGMGPDSRPCPEKDRKATRVARRLVEALGTAKCWSAALIARDILTEEGIDIDSDGGES